MNDQKQLKNNTVRTIVLMVFSLVCALLLWVYVTDTQGEDLKRPFPGVRVVFEGESTMRESRGLIVTDTSATSARVTLTGSRRTISSLSSTDLTVTVDLSTITRTGHYEYSPSVTYPARVDSSGIIAETSPETISFYVDILKSRTIDIEGLFNGSVAEGYVAEPLEFEPGAIIIYGPEQVLEQVDRAYVEVNRTDVDRTLTFDSTYVLLDADGNTIESDEITFDTETVSVTLPVSAVKEVDLTIELLPGGGATDNNVKWSLEPNTITLAGSSDALAGVNNISVATIDLAMVDEPFTETCRIPIPNDTEITSGTREAVLTLEIGGLYKRTVTVNRGNISCINVSEGYSAEVIDTSLSVVLRGPEDAVRAVSAANVRARADLTDYGSATGVVSVPVTVSIDSVDSNITVGAVGEYRVYVNITERTGEED